MKASSPASWSNPVHPSLRKQFFWHYAIHFLKAIILNYTPFFRHSALLAFLVFAAVSTTMAYAQVEVNSSRSPIINSRNEGLVQGSGILCKVVNVTQTTLESSVYANTIGGTIGVAFGAAVAAKQSNSTAAQLLGGLVGGGIGLKVAQHVGTDAALSIDLKCEDIKGIVSVVQQASLPISRGQEVILKKIDNKVRVLPI